MKLYSNVHSRGITVLPFLKELDIEDQVETIHIEYADLAEAEYLALNPMGKVPFLVDQGSVISETPAIFAYLADKYLEKGFAPAFNDPKRGEYLKWLFFCHGPLTEFIDVKSLGISEQQLETRKRSLGFGTEASIYRFIKVGLAQAKPYLLGNQISAADLFLAYWLIYAISFKIVPYFDEFKPFIQLVQSRDAVQGVEWVQAI